MKHIDVGDLVVINLHQFDDDGDYHSVTPVTVNQLRISRKGDSFGGLCTSIWERRKWDCDAHAERLVVIDNHGKEVKAVVESITRNNGKKRKRKRELVTIALP